MPYIASGTYGCVFKPKVKCTDPHKYGATAKYVRSVGKVFANEDEAYLEIENQLIVMKKIDPKSEFTAKFMEKCLVSRFQRKDELEKCPYALKQHPVQLVYEYGGISYDYMLKNNQPSIPKLKKLLKGLTEIFEGVAAMHKKGYVHQDIKPPNILFSNRHKHAILIDFGIMTRVEDVYAVKNNHVLTHHYPYFPPEFKLEMSKEWLEYKRLINMNFSTGALKEIKTVMKLSGVNFAEDLRATFTHGYRDPAKIDSYSLGVVLAMIINWAQPSLPRDHVIVSKVQSLIERMCHQDSKKRWTVYEASKAYKEFIKEFTRQRR